MIQFIKDRYVTTEPRLTYGLFWRVTIKKLSSP